MAAMSNPALTDKAFQDARAEELAGWASPSGPLTTSPPPAAPYSNAPGTPYANPNAPGFGPRGGFGAPPHIPTQPSPVSPWPPAPSDYKAMRVGGVASATGVLLSILVVTGFFGWQSVKVATGLDSTGAKVVTDLTIPPWLILSWIVGFVLAIVTVFRPKLARITGPLYAAAEGLLVGGISKIFEVQYDGIVLQAIGLTVGIFVIMLGLFAFKIIRVTAKLRMAIIASTGAICLIYLASMVAHLFGSDIPFIHDAGPIGIGFSLLVCGIASMNLLLDFDLVERGVEAQAPRYMEWYAAFGLVLTLVWLYLELLRLLSKLRQR